MAGGAREHPKSLLERLIIWKDFGGAITRTGELVTKPWELEEAELVIGLCDRFRSLPYPGSLMEQPVDLIRMLKIISVGSQDQGGGEYFDE